MKISVAICTWNRAKLLDQTLAGMHKLRIPAGVEWELLVVNNNCSDETDAVIERHAGSLPIRRLYEPTPGQSYARNLAIAEARGELILWTDDDVIVDPDWMSELLRAFRESNADIVFGKVVPWWETAPPPWFSSLFQGHFALLDYGPETKRITNPDQSMNGVNMAFRREAHRKLGGFCESLGLRKTGGGGGEDTEMFRRALDAGMQIVYTPRALIQHFIPKERCTKRYNRNRAWSGSVSHYYMLCQENKNVPWLLGLPRYYLRQQCGALPAYLRALLSGDRSRLFFNEWKLIRLCGLFREAFKTRGRHAPPGNKTRAEQSSTPEGAERAAPVGLATTPARTQPNGQVVGGVAGERT